MQIGRKPNMYSMKDVVKALRCGKAIIYNIIKEEGIVPIESGTYKLITEEDFKKIALNYLTKYPERHTSLEKVLIKPEVKKQEQVNRKDTLEKALDIIQGDRHNEYGPAQDHFKEAASVWSLILKQEVTSAQVILCLAALKLVRLSTKNNHQDSWVDLAGYAALGNEVASVD